MSLLMATAASQPRPTLAQAALCPRGCLHSHMCVCGPRSGAVRSAFHSRQHKVVRWRPSAGGAPGASTVQFHSHLRVILRSPSAMVAALRTHSSGRFSIFTGTMTGPSCYRYLRFLQIGKYICFFLHASSLQESIEIFTVCLTEDEWTDIWEL